MLPAHSSSQSAARCAQPLWSSAARPTAPPWPHSTGPQSWAGRGHRRCCRQAVTQGQDAAQVGAVLLQQAGLLLPGAGKEGKRRGACLAGGPVQRTWQSALLLHPVCPCCSPTNMHQAVARIGRRMGGATALIPADEESCCAAGVGSSLSPQLPASCCQCCHPRTRTWRQSTDHKQSTRKQGTAPNQTNSTTKEQPRRGKPWGPNVHGTNDVHERTKTGRPRPETPLKPVTSAPCSSYPSSQAL